MIELENGIHIESTRLWLDSKEPQDVCFISHAHIDHLGSHSTIIASAPTAQLYEHRMHPTQSIILEYGKRTQFDDMFITLYPAGHILGSSQILIENKGTRIVYSGDLRLKPTQTAEAIQIVPADILIMEATYGHPDRLFPDRELVVSRLCSEIDAVFADGKTPVIVAYSLGKGQELTKILGDHGYSLCLHNTIYDICEIYKMHGIEFAHYEKLQSRFASNKQVMVVPPYVLNSNSVLSMENKVFLYVSGWDQRNNSEDKIFPISDHADFNELVEYVRAVQPQEVQIVHGEPGFADILSEMGYPAQSHCLL